MPRVMANKIINNLYDISRKAGKCASTLNDIETLMSGNIGKYLKRKHKRKIRSIVNKKINKIF